MSAYRNRLVLAMFFTPWMAFSQMPEQQVTDPMQHAEFHQLHALNEQFAEEVNDKRETSGLVGLSVLVMQDGVPVLSATSGERKQGSGIAVTAKDQWHIGSITKSFTSTMIARLIEKGQLKWDLKVGEVFRDEQVDEAWHQVTLAQLLTHTSGAKANFSLYTSLYKQPGEDESESDLREREVLKALRKPPEIAPGSDFIYSNLGYTVAAAMIEKQLGVNWQELMSQEVLAPLGMTSFSFGPPHKTDAGLDQPLGHKKMFGFRRIANPTTDLSPILAPAGRLYVTLEDLAIYANDHLLGELGEGKLLKHDTYKRLHSPVTGNYGYGWVTKPAEDWSQGEMLWHNGSNGWWNALMVLVPDTRTVVLIASNDGNVSVAEKISWEIVTSALSLLQNSPNQQSTDALTH